MTSRTQRRHGTNGATPKAQPKPHLSGIQLAILELAAGFNHPTLQGRQPDGTTRNIGGSSEAWLAFVSTEPLAELLALLQMLTGAALGKQQPQQQPQAPRLYGPDGRPAF